MVLGLAIGVLGVALRPTPAGVRLEENLALQWLFAVRGPMDAPPGVAVVSIDKASSDQLGLTKEDWPPSRRIHAGVIRSLTRHGVSAIMMDVFFRVRRTPGEDDDLAAAIAESGKVGLFESVDRIRYAGGEIVQTRSPIEQLRNAALATAAFPLPEGETVRLFWTFVDASAGKVPTLPAVALQIDALPHLERFGSLLRQAGIGNLTDLPSRVATAAESRQLMTVLRREIGTHPDAARRALDLLDRESAGGEGRALAALVRLYSAGDTHYLNLYGPPGRIRTIPFHELLTESRNARVDLEGTVVFVGEGASGPLSSADQADTYRTVYSDNGLDLSGAEIAATAFANLLTNRTLRRVSFRAEFGILILFGLLAAVAGTHASGAVRRRRNLSARLRPLRDRSAPVQRARPARAARDSAPRAGAGRSLCRRPLPVPRRPETGAAGSGSQRAPELVRGVCLSTDIENYVAASAAMAPRDLALLMASTTKPSRSWWSAGAGC